MRHVNYPETKRVEVTEKHFGHTIPDPYRWLENDVLSDRVSMTCSRRCTYRWLENDVLSDQDVAWWGDAQNALTQSYLAAVPGRDVFHRRLSALLNYEQVSPPIKRGRLLTTYLVDAKTEVRRFAMDGTPDGIVELPGIGSAGGF